MNHHPPQRVKRTSPSDFSRRRFLRGAGVALFLPLFESLLPRLARAADAAPGLAVNARGIPVRLAFLYIPNGVNQKTWFPTGKGNDFQFNETMTPLEPLKKYIQVFAELDHRNANSNPAAPRDVTTGRGRGNPAAAGGDGPGDYARASGTWLTGTHIRKSYTDLRAGTSIDQVAAAQIGKLTRITSLQLTCDSVNMVGAGDSGYSNAYTHAISWKDATTPLPPEPDPRALFNRLFGFLNPKAPTAQGSLLDLVLDDAGKLRAELGLRDRQIMDQFLATVRQLETRVQRIDKAAATPWNPATSPAVPLAAGEVPLFEDKIQTMLTLLALAFQTDSTRISTCLLAHEGDNRIFSWLGGQTTGHSTLSRHMNDPVKLAQIAQIDHWYLTQLAAFLSTLDQIKDPDGHSLLENSMIVYGAGISDGNRQQHHNLPLILAGTGGGILHGGRYVQLPPTGTPMCNFFLGLVDKLGIQKVDSFGDSTGRLADL